MENLVELKRDDLQEVEGGWLLETVVAVGGVASGLFAIGFVAGVTYALVEEGIEQLNN